MTVRPRSATAQKGDRPELSVTPSNVPKSSSRGTSRAISRILSRVPADRARGRPSISGRRRRRPPRGRPFPEELPAVGCGLPGSSGGQPSNAPCLALLRVGFTEPRRSPGALVVSYTTVSPLPPPLAAGRAVCSLWHCPAGHPGWALPTTLPCGVRTFLGGPARASDAAARPARPPHHQRSGRRSIADPAAARRAQPRRTGPARGRRRPSSSRARHVSPSAQRRRRTAREHRRARPAAPCRRRSGRASTRPRRILPDRCGEHGGLDEVDAGPVELARARWSRGAHHPRGSAGSAAAPSRAPPRPARSATQTSPAYRSTSRRNGAVTWAYGAATAACVVAAGRRAVERGVARAAEQRRRPRAGARVPRARRVEPTAAARRTTRPAGHVDAERLRPAGAAGRRARRPAAAGCAGSRPRPRSISAAAAMPVSSEICAFQSSTGTAARQRRA